MIVKRSIYYTIIVLLSILSGCTDDYVKDIYTDEELTISRYLESNPDYTELVSAMKRTQYFTILSLQGQFTMLVADNDAFKRYYTSKGVAGLGDLDDETVKQLVETLIIETKVTSVNFRIGRMAYPFSGESLIMSFGTGGLGSAKINGILVEAYDIARSNGVMHKMTDVITPADKTIAELFQERPAYSIFYEALQATGIIDTLASTEEYNKNRYTVFAESNEAFTAVGINNYDDLRAAFSDTDDVTDANDGLNQYMRYHILTADLTALEFKSGIYNTVYNYPLKLEISDRFKLNTSIDDQGEETCGLLNLDDIDNLAWNGIVHGLSAPIPLIELSPEPMLHLGTDVCISAEELDFNKIIYAGDASPPWISTDSEVLQYLCTNVGDYVEFYSPYLFAVTYKVYYEPSTFLPGKSILGLYVNDELIGEPFINEHESFDLRNGKKGYYVGTVDITEGGIQRIKVKVEGAYLYPDDNVIRLKKIYFEPAN